jgi:hypothetical protein
VPAQLGHQPGGKMHDAPARGRLRLAHEQLAAA